MSHRRTSITEVAPLSDRWLRVTFDDGAVHEVDLTAVLAAGGAFREIRDDDGVFRSVKVDPEFGTVVWPGDVDLDPDVLRGDEEPASGASLPRRVVQPA